MTEFQKFDIIETANPVLTVAPIEEETEMLGATDEITALYCRLSVEDMIQLPRRPRYRNFQSVRQRHRI